jgi:two-component system, chemotaxis family, CheB/CheR fusion protein
MNMEKNDVSPPTDNFLVVGVGASSGGLEAFKQLIKAVPMDSGIAFILVQHLAPDHESILAEILQKNTLIPIQQITNNLHIKPNHIYIIPANKLLTAKDGVLKLSARPPNASNVLSIDRFFNSLASVYQAQAIGILLSGNGNDGTEGLRAIKKSGGVTFAQNHETAAYQEMPRNAITAKVVDFELSPEEIIKHLMLLTNILSGSMIEDKSSGPLDEDIFFSKIISVIDLTKGVDFTYYKQKTIKRRIARRMAMKNYSRVEDYFNYLEHNAAELDVLFQDILIPVTEFFRDAKMFDVLFQTALASLVKQKTANDTLRVWSVGCSTGQETFSLAMLLSEYFERSAERCKIQIFATDISELGIMHARSGLYSVHEVSNISAARLARFFTRTEKGYQINKSIRDLCVFATHNILTNPPFAGIDLISCRNVLIYMDTFLQRKAMATFHYSLNGRGMLLLGKSESVGSSSDLFAPFSETDKIYLRKQVPGRYTHIAVKRRADFLANGVSSVASTDRPKDDFLKHAEEKLLARSPDGVIVNDHLEIVHFRGTTGNWLEQASGKPSMSILKMARRELYIDLRNAIHKAKTTRLPFVKEGILMQFDGVRKFATVEVIPLPDTINLYYLILFRNTQALTEPKYRKNSRDGEALSKAHEFRAEQLEKELFQTREDMRTISEDQEAGNEELLSANEELLSGSEELRSLNEELEISKEELQSTVEELSVSNQELAFRIDQLNYSQKYAEAIVTTIGEPIVVLDKEIRVKSANSAFFKMFQRREQDTVGKAFYELDNQQWNIPEFSRILDRTLNEKYFFEQFEARVNFAAIGERVMLLKARKIFYEGNSEQLVLLAIEDITERKALEDSLKASTDYFRTMLDSSPLISTAAQPDGKVIFYNKYFLEYSGFRLDDIVAQGWEAIIDPADIERTRTAWSHAIKTGDEFYQEIRLKRRDGAYRWHLSRATPVRNNQGEITSWVGTSTDIHNQKMFAEELERKVKERTAALLESNHELAHSNKNLEQFAFIASHDLQEPLRKIQTFSMMLSDNFAEELPPAAPSLISKIAASSKRMSELIKDTLRFLGADSSSNQFKNVDLNDILHKVLTDFSLIIEEKKALIQADSLPYARIIPGQVNQLFYNLISNSLKFTREGSIPEINISSRKLSLLEVLKYPKLKTDQSYLEILFADNGIGFDEKYKEKIFQIFQRLHNQNSFPGTGMGLALCKKIVKNHNGEIFAESKQDYGALFHVILPFQGNAMTSHLLSGYRE